MKQMKSNGVEPAALAALRVLRRTPRPQFVERGIKRLPRDEHRRGEPVRERESRIERQHAMRGAQALFTPAHEREPQVVTPIVGIERNRLARGGYRLPGVPTSMQHERTRAPRLTGRWIEPAAFTRVMTRLPKRVEIGDRIRARGLEPEDARIGHPDVDRCVVRLRAQRVHEGLARPRHRVAVERFERRASVHERAIGGEQRVQGRVGVARGSAFNLGGEAVSAARQCFDVGRTVGLVAKRPPQAGDRLLDAVIADRHVLPARLDQRVLGNDTSGAGRQQNQYVEVAVGDRNRLAVANDAPPR